MHLYKISLVWQIQSNGQSFLFLQLHWSLGVILSLFTFLLWVLIILKKISCVTVTTSTVFLLNILWSLFHLRKCISSKLRNCLATLVVTLLPNGGLNQIIDSGVEINKNYILHGFKFHLCLRSSGEQRCYKYFLKILKYRYRYYQFT